MSRWDGAWVEEHTGARFSGVGLVDLRQLAGLALRRNKARLLLLVSTALGKHVPAIPSTISEAAHRLGTLVLEGDLTEPVLVIGFAETATALGYGVAEMLGDAHYIHTTRTPSNAPIAAFSEEHSHAQTHYLAPLEASVLASARTIVLVDDEISTGRTAINLMRSISDRSQCRNFLVASLVDSRGDTERLAMDRAADEAGFSVAVFSISTVGLVVPEKPSLAVDARSDPTRVSPGGERGPVQTLDIPWPDHLNLHGSEGFSRADRAELTLQSRAIAATVLAEVVGDPRIHVVGVEEFMTVPLALAGFIEEAGFRTSFSSTTRSPAAVIDEEGYAIRSGIEFFGDANQAEHGRFLYNVEPNLYDLIIVVAPRSGPYAASAGLIDSLAAGSAVLSVSIRGGPEPISGPEFSTYNASDVRWLLSDVSASVIESTGIERERALQSTSHYSETLPIEFQPDAEYTSLFDEALRRNARSIAVAVGRVAEQLVAARGDELVLASLARAGTPVGVLVRRWLRLTRGLDVPHYTMSIILDRGLDPVALRFLSDRHGPDNVVFIDGWTGKGAISRELIRSLAALGPRASGFVPELGVLADPAGTATWAGTHQDILVPSACLNSTVSGLVSRTVSSSSLIAAGRFQGAKFYSQLAHIDRSQDFIDAISAHFDQLSPSELVPEAPVPDAGRRVRDELARLRSRYLVDRDAFIKPGLCEATRVLLRRVPELLVLKELGMPDGRHLEVLARSRGVRVLVDHDLLFSAVGIIRSVSSS